MSELNDKIIQKRIELYIAYVGHLGRYYPYLTTLSLKDKETDAMLYMNEEGTEWIDIKDGEEYVGFLIVSYNKENCHPDANFEICELYVNPEYRRKGLAAKTVKEYVYKHPGIYSLDILVGNNTASRFWYKIFKDLHAEYVNLQEVRGENEYIQLYGYRVTAKEENK